MELLFFYLVALVAVLSGFLVIKCKSPINSAISLVMTFFCLAIFYVMLHFLVYAGLDQRFDLAAILEDIAERPYITIGMTALVLLIPLALTSTKAMMRRLGRRWQQLHRLVYPIAILGVWHFYWQVKLDTLEALVYAAVLAALLGFRLTHWWRRRTPGKSVDSRSNHDRSAHARRSL